MCLRLHTQHIHLRCASPLGEVYLRSEVPSISNNDFGHSSPRLRMGPDSPGWHETTKATSSISLKQLRRGAWRSKRKQRDAIPGHNLAQPPFSFAIPLPGRPLSLDASLFDNLGQLIHVLSKSLLVFAQVQKHLSLIASGHPDCNRSTFDMSRALKKLSWQRCFPRLLVHSVSFPSRAKELGRTSCCSRSSHPSRDAWKTQGIVRERRLPASCGSPCPCVKEKLRSDLSLGVEQHFLQRFNYQWHL